MENENDGGKEVKNSVLEQEERYGKVEYGATQFMRKWHGQEAGTFAKRQLARQVEEDGTASAEPKRNRGRNNKGSQVCL